MNLLTPFIRYKKNGVLRRLLGLKTIWFFLTTGNVKFIHGMGTSDIFMYISVDSESVRANAKRFFLYCIYIGGE